MIIIKMSSARYRPRLSKLGDRHRQLLEELSQARLILRGSFSQVHTHCGKPNCWCANSNEGHAHARLTWSENGRLTTRKVPPESTERVIQLTDNYRQFRSRRRQLLSLQGQIQEMLDDYEKALINQTRKPLTFLAVEEKTSAPTRRTRQKGGDNAKAASQ